MLFSEIPGNVELKTLTINSINAGRIPHAQLISSREGGGNLAFAWAYVQYLFCENRHENDSCGVCAACHKVSKLIHPDLKFTFPVNTNEDVKRDPDTDSFMALWREALIQEPFLSKNDWYEAMNLSVTKSAIINALQCNEIIKKFSFSPYEAPFQVMIIWLPELIYYAAIPKLLKVVEEPPKNSLFLFVSDKPEDILSTITSRTQQIKLNNINDFDMLGALMNEYDMDMEKAKEIVNLADGNYRLAKKQAGEPEDTGNLLLFQKWMRAAYGYQIPQIFQLSEETAKLSKEKQKNFYTYCLHMLRETLPLNENMTELSRVTNAEKSFLENLSRFLTPYIAIKFSEIFNKSIYYIDRNANAKIMASNNLLLMAQLFRP